MSSIDLLEMQSLLQFPVYIGHFTTFSNHSVFLLFFFVCTSFVNDPFYSFLKIIVNFLSIFVLFLHNERSIKSYKPYNRICSKKTYRYLKILLNNHSIRKRTIVFLKICSFSKKKRPFFQNYSENLFVQ